MIHPGEKYCKKGKHWVDRKDFYKHHSSLDGLQGDCKKCMYEAQKILAIKKKEGTIKAF